MAYTVTSSVAALNRAFNNADATPAAFAATAAELAADQVAGANKFDDGTLSDLALSTKVLTNMGILPSTVKEVVALEAALADYFAGPGKGARGFVVLQLADILSSFAPSDVFYGAASVAWNAEVAASAAKAPTTGFTSGATDIVAGTELADIFNAATSSLASANTLSATDSVDGGAGNDTLNLSLAENFTGFSSGSSVNVETISITNSAPTARIFNAKGVSNATTFAIDANDQQFNLSGLNSIPTVKLTNQNSSTARTFDVEFAAASIPTGTADAMSIELKDVGLAAVAATTTAVAVAVKPSTVTLSNIEIANVTTSGTTVDVGFGGTLKTINLAGSAATTIAATPTTLTAFDASTSTGAVTASLTTGGTAARITSIKGGTAVDKITADVVDLAANATIAGGAGSDTLTLNGSAGGTKQFVMSDVETVTFGITGALTFSGAKTSGLTAVTSTSANTAAVTLVAMGANPLEIKTSGSTVNNGAISSDSTGAVTVSYAATSATIAAATTANTPLADYTLSEMTGALTVNVGAFVDNTGSTIVADKATTLVINTTSGKTTDSTPVQKTVLGGSVDAAKATSIAITSAGSIGSGTTATAYTVNAGSATTATINQGTDAANLKLNTAKLQTLDVTAGNTFDLTGSTLSVLSSVKADVAKGTFTLIDLPTASSVTVTGAGATSAAPSIASLGTLGAIGNTYGLSLNASGLAGGLTATNVTGGAGFTTNIDVSGVKALSTTTTAVSLQAIGAATAGAVTVNAAGVAGAVSMTTVDSAGAISVTASPTKTFSIGNVTSASNAGNVDVNLDGTVGAVTIGTFTGNTVTVKASDTIGGVKNAAGTVNTFVVSAKTGANIEVSSLEASNVTINSSSTSAGLAVTLKGGSFADTVTVNGTTNSVSMVLTGDMGLGTDTVAVNSAYAGANTQTISLANLKNYETSTLTGSNGKEVIIGGSGADKIIGGAGQDTLTGGAGADQFVFIKGNSTASAPDVITDFTAGSTGDRITSDAAAGTVATAVTTGTNLTISNAVVTFTATQTSLVGAATTVSNAVTIDGTMALFTYGGKSYAFIADGTAGLADTDILVELTGVVLPTTALTATAASGTGYTGLSGFGA